MLKKLIAAILCLLLAVSALAEGGAGMHWEVSDFAAELDGESAAPELTASLDCADGTGIFNVYSGGETLGTAKMSFESDGGAKFRLNDGKLFALSSEYMAENTGSAIVNGELAQAIREKGLFPMLSGFMAQLDKYEEDQFTLQISDLPEWTSGSIVLAEMWMNMIGCEPELLPLSVKRDSLGYTLTADGEYDTTLTFRWNGERIKADLIIVGMEIQIYAAPDGGVDLNINAGRLWYEGTEIYDVTVKYQPQPNGSATYSVVHQYQSEWNEPVEGCDNMYSRLNISGSKDAQDVHSAQVRFSRDAETFSDLTISFSVSGKPETMEIAPDEGAAESIQQSFGSAAVVLRKEIRNFRQNMSPLFSTSVLGDTLTEVFADPVAGALWNAVTP